MINKRREFVKQAGLLTAYSFLVPVLKATAATVGKKDIKILLRSAWQTVNIGDTGHTFGIMELFKEYLPAAKVVLWARNLELGADELMAKTYPNLEIINGTQVGSNGVPEDPRLKAAFEECDIMVHSSGYNVTARRELWEWWNATKKPFGVYGVSLDEADDKLKELINKASFFYCRDSESLRYLQSLKLSCPIQGLAFDATFAIQLENEALAKSYLQSVGLKDGEFICVIPRLRYTPYWQMKNKKPTAEEEVKEAVSNLYKETDAAKLREVIIEWVRTTGFKVLACAEVTYQVGLSKEVLVDPLPEDVKKNVVWRSTFWNPDEAGSIYAKSRAIVTYELHSAIISFSKNIPAIHLKQSTDTRKGQMWRDIGLGDWYFQIDETPGSQIATELMKIHSNYPAALQKIQQSKKVVKRVQHDTMNAIKKTLK
ncbi:polysaccharide pyruvyl transferase family protein [Pedobacter sp.]